MNEQNSRQSPLPGFIYGICTYWIAIAGMLVSIVGMLHCFSGSSGFTKVDTLTKDLWAGKNPAYIWKTSSDPAILSEKWSTKKLSCGDGIAMLGISICCLAGVVGAWGAFAAMLIKKERPVIFLIFAIIICILLSCSAMGLIKIH